MRRTWTRRFLPVALLVAGLLALPVAGAAPTAAVAAPGSHGHALANGGVLDIYQSPSVSEQGNFSVHLEVASPAEVQFAYFTFCQLSSPLCYKPVAMSPAGGNWLVGTTHPMSEYNGMVVGVHAGYNITIEYANNTNVTEPRMPNAFSNLTIAQSVTGEFMFEMTVVDQVYGLSGVVSNAATGAPLAGATVTVVPGNNSTTTGPTGRYDFAGLANGSYTLSASEAGYRTVSATVVIGGRDTVRNISLASGSATTGLGGSGGISFLSGPIPLAAAVAAVAVVGLGGLLYARSRKGRGGPPRNGPERPPARSATTAPEGATGKAEDPNAP